MISIHNHSLRDSITLLNSQISRSYQIQLKLCRNKSLNHPSWKFQLPRKNLAGTSNRCKLKFYHSQHNLQQFFNKWLNLWHYKNKQSLKLNKVKKLCKKGVGFRKLSWFPRRKLIQKSKWTDQDLSSLVFWLGNFKSLKSSRSWRRFALLTLWLPRHLLKVMLPSYSHNLSPKHLLLAKHQKSYIQSTLSKFSSLLQMWKSLSQKKISLRIQLIFPLWLKTAAVQTNWTLINSSLWPNLLKSLMKMMGSSSRN